MWGLECTIEHAEVWEGDKVFYHESTAFFAGNPDYIHVGFRRIFDIVWHRFDYIGESSEV